MGTSFNFKLSGTANAIIITAVDLHRGRIKTQRCEPASGVPQAAELAQAQLFVEAHAGGCTAQLLLDVSTVPPGTWLLSFEAEIDGVLGRIEDAEQGRIGSSIIVDELGRTSSPDAALERVPLLTDAEFSTATRTLAKYFHVYWSPESGQRLAWLGGYWSALMQRAKQEPARYVGELTNLCGFEADPETRPGWLPKQFAAGQLPELFALRRHAYRSADPNTGQLASALRAMSSIRSALAVTFKEVVSPSVAFAFANPLRIDRGDWPRGFSLQQYRGVLGSTSIDGVLGLDDGTAEMDPRDWLGRLHLELGWRDLERRFVLNEQFSTNRRAFSISVARRLAQRQQSLPTTNIAGLAGQSPVISSNLITADAESPGRAQLVDNLRHLEHACSLLAWHCRLETRQKGALARYLAELQSCCAAVSLDGMTLDGFLSFHIQVAPVMFGYYLMLWELVQASEFDPHVLHG